MQSLDYKLKTSNTSYVTARHDVQYFPSSLSSFSPTTSRVCRIPLTSGTSFIDPESIKIAFRVRNTDGTNPLAPATPNPACFVQRVQVFANGQRCDDINYYGRTVAVHDLLKGREYNRNKAMEGFDEVNDPRIARAVHQGGYADVLLRPTMVGILRCGKMLPPQLNLVVEIEFADAATALWSENAGAHPAGATLSTDFEIQNVQVLASQVVLDSALVESFNRVLLSGRSLVFSYPTVHTQQSSVPNGVAEHNVTGTVAGATLTSTGAVSGSSLSISGAASVGLLSSATGITGSTLTINNTANAGNFTTVGDVSTGTLTASGAATAASFAATGALGRHADHHRCGLRGPAGLREPGLHLHGHERRSVDGQRGVQRRDELGHGLRAAALRLQHAHRDQHLRLLGRSLPDEELRGLEQAASVQQQRGLRQRPGAAAAGQPERAGLPGAGRRGAPVRAHHDQRRGAGADQEPLHAAVPDHNRGQHGQRGLQRASRICLTAG